MKFGGASFVCRHTRESISYPPPKGQKSIYLQYTYQYAVFALSPAGTDLPLIVAISIIINKLTMINIATASRSDIIIIVRLLLLLLFHINNIYMEYPYMREILYATGYNKEKKKNSPELLPRLLFFFFYSSSKYLEEMIHVIDEILIRVADGYPESRDLIQNFVRDRVAVFAAIL